MLRSRTSLAMASSEFLILLQLLALCVAVHGQPGFLSLDCGKPAGYEYTDEDTGIVYVSDSDYVDTGISQKIPDATGVISRGVDLRRFPNGGRSCYTLPVTIGNRYLVRPSFRYGNYDGKNRMPTFDIYVDLFRYGSLNVSNSSLFYYSEFILVASYSHMSVCLVEVGYGETFMSALEMRSLTSDSYTETNADLALASYQNFDFGAVDDRIKLRYNTDPYDRYWVPWTKSVWTKLQASGVATGSTNSVPNAIASTAVTPSNGSKLDFGFYLSTVVRNPKYHFIMHFAELEKLARSQSRIFNISLNGEVLYPSLEPSYLVVSTLRTNVPKHYDTVNFSIYQANGSTLPPIINAIEIYITQERIANGTNVGDVDAIMSVKAFYNLVEQNWAGDPCNPKDFLWKGLDCRYEADQFSRITSLNLSSYGLAGEISPSIGNLTELQYLDLSRNNLTGAIPDFLADLSSLVYINLTGNNFSGEVPQRILDRATSGNLTLSFGDIQTKRINEGGHKKSNAWKIAVAIVAAICAVALFLALVFWIKFKRKTNRGNDSKIGQKMDVNFGMASFRGQSKQFTYSQLAVITNNFAKVIGRGGFGVVYQGELENGKAVAVKMLLESSSQGDKEFQTEAQLLTRIYHKNLVTLVGYCKEKDNMLLVYEYMASGSLANHLSDENQSSNALSWKERLRIGTEAAQGLDYLHKGCKPPIIHRDIKASNILLGEGLEAKIADFGLSRIFYRNEEQSFVSTAIMGTPGYLDPEYSSSSRLTEKSDVYSFGIVLLELITGKPAIIRIPTTMNIVKWIEPLLATGDLNQMVDPNFRGDYNPNSVWKTLELAMACVAQFSIQRPNMNDVSAALKDCLLLEQKRDDERLA